MFIKNNKAKSINKNIQVFKIQYILCTNETCHTMKNKHKIDRHNKVLFIALLITYSTSTLNWTDISPQNHSIDKNSSKTKS